MKQAIQLSDAELITAIQQGNDNALELLVLRHKDQLYTTIQAIVKDQWLAEDIFQDTFIKIIGIIRQGKYDERGKFMSWAARVAYNLCMDAFRKTKSRPVVVMQDGTDVFNFIHSTEQEYIDKEDEKLRDESIRNMIDQLPAAQREVLILRMYADLSFKEIAELTKVSINTSLGRMRYALLNLRKLIEEQQMVLR